MQTEEKDYEPGNSPFARASYMRGKLSEVGKRTSEGVLTCPNCGGTSFKAKRSFGGKLAMGLLAPKTEVRCETCGVTFRRG